MLLITDCVSRGGMCVHLPLKRVGRSLFHLNDLVISRKKIREKPTLFSQLRRDLRPWAQWRGVSCIFSRREAESSGLYL